jgi:hypothetical protein
VVRPNFDTLYSQAWLDLTAGPVILHAPDTDDRYYMLPMIDMWTDVFANPGKRTTGTGAKDFVVTGRGYTGELPGGLPVFAASTPYVWIIGRTQTNGPADFDPNYDTVTKPLKTVNNMGAVDFLTHAADLLSVNPPHATDFSQLARVANLGIEAGKPPVDCGVW